MRRVQSQKRPPSQHPSKHREEFARKRHSPRNETPPLPLASESMRHLEALLSATLGNQFWESPRLRKRVRQLSLLFTEERQNLPQNYMDTFLDAYCAAFLPLNVLKFLKILPAGKVGTRWIDFGAGPATASLAALLHLHKNKKPGDLPLAPLRIDLVEPEPEALTLGQKLLEDLSQRLGIPIEVHTHTHWQPAADWALQYDTFFAGNVINEWTPGSPTSKEGSPVEWVVTRNQQPPSLSSSSPIVYFWLEPSHRVASQKLIRWRERLRQAEGGDVQFLAPCSHQERCPLHRSQHWCHFSEPSDEPLWQEWNRCFFDDPRSWLKFSYLVFQTKGPALNPMGKEPYVFSRAIGDLHPSGPGYAAIDLCTPTGKFSLRLPASFAQLKARELKRGHIVEWKPGGDKPGEQPRFLKALDLNGNDLVFPAKLRKSTPGRSTEGREKKGPKKSFRSRK